MDANIVLTRRDFLKFNFQTDNGVLPIMGGVRLTPFYGIHPIEAR